MLNPHFIFNALNSVQYYINANDLLLANEYLAKFGKLIRMNLEHSYNNSVSLQNEIQFLELYLSLEKLRFDGLFTYQISVNSDIQAERLFLPPMFLQPFVENALIHGILPAKRQGMIAIKINLMSKNRLKIEIEDNGVGFEAAAKLKKTTYTSRSMDIIKQRVALMNEENKEDKIIFEDNSANNASGSRVIIYLQTQEKAP